MKARMVLRSVAAGALVVALGAAPAWATNGMSMIGFGTRANGMGGADIAVDGDAGSLGGNPAVISLAAPSSSAVQLTALMPRLTYKDAGGNDIDGERHAYVMPFIGYVHRLADSPLSLGLGVYAQGGMGVDFQDVMTPVGTKDEMTSEVAFLRVNPTASYQVSDALSVGATVMLGYATAKFSLFPETPVPGMPSGLDVKDLTSFGYAGRVGAQLKAGEQWRFGATYTTESKIDLDGGTATLNFGPMGGKQKYDAQLDDFTWPQEVEVGVAFLPVKGLTVAADVKWVNWSATVDQAKLKVSNPPAGMPPTPFPGPDGTMLQSDTAVFDMGWDDQVVYAVGVEYAVNESHTVRCGFNHGANPVPDEKLNPLFPAIVESHLTAGYGWTNGRWSFDAAAEYAFEKSQTNPNPGSVEIAHSQLTVSAGVGYRY